MPIGLYLVKTIMIFDINIDFIDALPFVKSEYNKLEIASQLIGDYNFNNIAAAIAIGTYFKVKDSAIKAAIENYTPTNNRSQIIQKETNKIILDAYNANPTSMRAALLNFEKQPSTKKIAFIGDMFELGKDAEKEHQNIADLVASLNIDQVVLIGENFFKTQTTSKASKQFKCFDDFKDWLDNSKIENTYILIKGSRGMALERILEFI